MLRRVASHLFWTARYLERAEWRARLVDVNYHLLIESPPHGTEPWAPLLAITGEREAFADNYAGADEKSVLEFFSFDDRNPSSIRSCIHFARDNARALRNRISSELWLELNTLYLDTLEWSSARLASAGVYDFFAELRARFYRVAGVIHNTLPRDLSYDFLALGMMLERVENVSRLLDVKYHFLLPRAEGVGGPVDLLQWAAVLRSASALEAYRRSYGNAIRIDRVVEILLFDSGFPRSGRFCLERLQTSLRRIAAGVIESRPAAGRLATQGLEALMTNVSAAGVLSSGLHNYLLEIQEHCAAIGASVFAEYLRFE